MTMKSMLDKLKAYHQKIGETLQIIRSEFMPGTGEEDWKESNNDTHPDVVLKQWLQEPSAGSYCFLLKAGYQFSGNCQQFS